MYSTRTATVTVTYADTLTEGGRGEWQYVYSTRTATVTVTYVDTLTEGPCTVCGLCHMICHMMYVCVREIHLHGLYMYIPCVRVTMDVRMVL